MLAQIISRELERRHLASDILLSERKPMVGQLILKAIDPARSLLTQQDIRNVPVKSLPNQIESGNLETVYRLYGLSLKRSGERLDFWLSTLSKGVSAIDLSDIEELQVRDQGTPWVSDLTALKDLWRKQLENQAINLLLADRSETEMDATKAKKIESSKRVQMTFFLV